MTTNLPKHSATITNTKIDGIAAWDDSVATWDSAFYFWDNAISVSNQTKHAATITNQPKS